MTIYIDDTKVNTKINKSKLNYLILQFTFLKAKVKTITTLTIQAQIQA